jgi:hypothetical protein
MNYQKDEELINKKTGEKIIIENDSTHGVYYRVDGNNQLRFATYAALEAYENQHTKERKFLDSFTAGYLEKCRILKNTPMNKWGEVIGKVGEDMKNTVLSWGENIEKLESLISKFKTE